jgi:TatD DNase family protein
MLTDTHCHLDFNKFDEDRDAVIQRALDAGIRRILIPGLDWESSLAAVHLAGSRPEIFAAIGYHPTDVEKWEDSSYEKLKSLVMESGSLLPEIQDQAPGLHKKIVAIGEIGLDYYWDSAPHDIQIAALTEQLELAANLKLPVILHMREKNDAVHGSCAEDLLRILENWLKSLRSTNNIISEKPGVLHSFSGNLETAQKAIDMNFYIGITGPITYKNTEAKREMVKSLPLENLLIETDAPYLAPVPHRGKRNEPAFVRHIADKIAEIHNKNPEEVAAITTTNAARLFSWGG